MLHIALNICYFTIHLLLHINSSSTIKLFCTCSVDYHKREKIHFNLLLNNNFRRHTVHCAIWSCVCLWGLWWWCQSASLSIRFVLGHLYYRNSAHFHGPAPQKCSAQQTLLPSTDTTRRGWNANELFNVGKGAGRPVQAAQAQMIKSAIPLHSSIILYSESAIEEKHLDHVSERGDKEGYNKATRYLLFV